MKNAKQEIDNYINTVVDTLTKLDRESIISFINLLIETYNNEGTIYVFGNGGSGANATHFCGDLLKGVSSGLDKRFKAVCLNDNRPAFEAIANDCSYEDVFVEQLKNFLKKEDLVIGISGSGNSANVVKALEYSNSKGVRTVAICGFDGGKIKQIAKLAVHVNINDMEISEDIHSTISHCVKKILIKRFQDRTI